MIQEPRSKGAGALGGRPARRLSLSAQLPVHSPDTEGSQRTIEEIVASTDQSRCQLGSLCSPLFPALACLDGGICSSISKGYDIRQVLREPFGELLFFTSEWILKPWK